jgi:hypothetical protein
MGVSLNLIWHMRGEAVLGPSSSHHRVIQRLDTMLDRQQKRILDRGPDFIEFESPLFSLGPNWLAMVIYDRGRFWIVRDGPAGARLRYDLRSLHGFLFCLAASAIAFAISGSGGDWLQAAWIAALAFGWLYGMNMVLAYARIPGLIQRAVSSR